MLVQELVVEVVRLQGQLLKLSRVYVLLLQLVDEQVQSLLLRV